ncbi:hypothetical protein F4810DRAFT_708744 [Camillea tinctor]|nr:hypothetical protein F4810DRAFT_708744 [Camillea tinctor]
MDPKPNPKPISNIIRPVGSAAQFNTSRHNLGLCRSVINTCYYTVSTSCLEQHALESVIENALARVMIQHGILCVGIAGEDTNAPAFVHLKTIDLRRMIEWKEMLVSIPNVENDTGSPSSQWDGLLLRSLEKCHEPLWEDLDQKPGWKIIIHHDPRQLAPDGSQSTVIALDISFAFHHAYADGKSAYIFHESLLRALNDPPSTTPPPSLQAHTLHLARPPVIPPPLENLIPFTLSWPYLLRTLFQALIWDPLIPSWLKPAPHLPWTGSLIDPSQPRCHLRLLSLPPRRLAALLARCRAHDATLTGLLHALLLASLSARVPAPRFAGTTPVSLAPYAAPFEGMHCLFTGHDTAFDAASPSSALVWTQAARVTAQLRARAAALPRDDVMALMGYVSDWGKFHTDRFGGPRAHTWEVSNVGSARFGREGGWRIGRAVFTQGANPLGAALKVNVAGVVGEAGGVWITVGWQEGAVPAEVAEGVVEDLGKWIDVEGEGGMLGLGEDEKEKGGL